jgi:hypothetical protein
MKPQYSTSLAITMLANSRSGSCSKGYINIADPGRKAKVEERLNINDKGISALPLIR